MDKVDNNRQTARIGLFKVILWGVFVCIVLGTLFFLSSMQVGPVKKMRGILLLEYVGIIKDKRSDAELILSLKSYDEVEQFNAVTAIAHRRYNSENALALLDYLRSDTGTKRVKQFAVWALGELHAPEAKAHLCSLRGNMDFNQSEVDKAIKKVEGKIPKPFWRK
ncbi:MAG: hypothetical protein PVH84_10085 [Candidatus Aminicenantes bacterium]|jgi:hypothetical protein